VFAQLVANPTTATTTGYAPGLRAASSPFAGRISALVRSRLGSITAAVFNLNDGKTWSLEPDDLQATASIVKVDILATLLAEVRPSGALPSAAVRATAAEMIEESDNDAATKLWDAVGGHSAIKAFDQKLGMEHTSPSSCLDCPGFAWPGWGLTTTSAGDQVTLVRSLVSPNRWLSRAQRRWALALMENVVPEERWGVSNGAPASVIVALKNGWVPLPSGLWQIDSIGWVDGQGRDYVAAVLATGNPSERYGIDTVNAIASVLYANLGPNNPKESV
jgi:hypothetical protein